jgi:arsenite methyltransferase
MAELETTETPTSSCCSATAQETCCEPEAKSSCCGDGHGDGCGCSEGSADAADATSTDDVREVVRERYAAAATAALGSSDASCCGSDAAVITDEQRAVFGSALYEDGDRDELPDAAKLASLGCGNPTAVADLHEGETVLDLGSGGGIDVLLSARRVGPTGKAYGLDMTDEMLELARANQAEAGVENVEFVKGTIE